MTQENLGIFGKIFMVIMVIGIIIAVILAIFALLVTVAISFSFYYKIAYPVLPRNEKDKTSKYIIRGFILQSASSALAVVPTVLFYLSAVSDTPKRIVSVIGMIILLVIIPLVLRNFRNLYVEQYIQIFYGAVICAGIAGPASALLVYELIRYARSFQREFLLSIIGFM